MTATTATQRLNWDLAARRFRVALRQRGLIVHSVSWVQGGYPGGEIAAIEVRDDLETDRALEVLGNVSGLDITRVTPTRIFIGPRSQS